MNVRLPVPSSVLFPSMASGGGETRKIGKREGMRKDKNYLNVLHELVCPKYTQCLVLVGWMAGGHQASSSSRGTKSRSFLYTLQFLSEKQ